MLDRYQLLVYVLLRHNSDLTKHTWDAIRKKIFKIFFNIFLTTIKTNFYWFIYDLKLNLYLYDW